MSATSAVDRKFLLSCGSKSCRLVTTNQFLNSCVIMHDMKTTKILGTGRASADRYERSWLLDVLYLMT